MIENSPWSAEKLWWLSIVTNDVGGVGVRRVASGVAVARAEVGATCMVNPCSENQLHPGTSITLALGNNIELLPLLGTEGTENQLNVNIISINIPFKTFGFKAMHSSTKMSYLQNEIQH